MNNNICIYCGSAVGIKAEYAESARKVGQALARHGLGLVYGGGRVGLMGILADAVLAGGGRVIGVIPDPLATKEIAHDGLTELHVVADMHQRKALMARRAIAFLTLPGGIGTFEEFFETLSWSVLGLHQKPLGSSMSRVTSTPCSPCSTTRSPNVCASPAHDTADHLD